MEKQSLSSNPDYLSPFTGDGIDFRNLTEAGLDVRPVPLSAGTLGKNAEWHYEHVFSPFWRLYFARHANMFIRSGGKTFRLPALGFLLIPAEMHFHCDSDGSTEHLWIHFSLQPRWLEGFKQPFSINGQAMTRGLARTLWQHMESGSPAHSQLHLAKALLHILFSCLNLFAPSRVPHPLQRALRVIRQQLHSSLSVRELARQSGCSPEHLAHLFRKHLQHSPSEYIRKIRIQEAARRLAYTEDTIEAIADDLRFANRHHLSRVFKTVMREPPAAFRKRFKERSI